MPAVFLVRAEAWFVSSSLSNAGRSGSDAPLPYCFALVVGGVRLPLVRVDGCPVTMKAATVVAAGVQQGVLPQAAGWGPFIITGL